MPGPIIDLDDFHRSGWEDIVSSAPEASCDRYADLFVRKLAEAGDSADEKIDAVFRLLAAVTSLRLQEDPEGEPFGPAVFVYSGNSWTIDDFSDSHLDLFAQAAPEIADPELRARLADVSWIVRKQDFQTAILAVHSYLESARTLEGEGGFDHVDRLRRARDLAASLGRGQRELYQEVLRRVGEAADRVDEADVDFRSVRLLEILAGSDPEDAAALAVTAGRLAGKAEELARWRAARHLWELEAEFHGAQGAHEDQKAARVRVAETHEKEAEDLLARPGSGYLAAAYHLKLAVEAMRRIGGMGDRVGELHARLLDYEREGMKEMEISSVRVDASEDARRAEARVSGKDLPKALLALAIIALPTDMVAFRKMIERQFEQFVGMGLMPTQMLNERGMTVGVTPSTAPEGMGGRQLQVLAEMHSQAAHEHYPRVVHGFIEPAKRTILREHRLGPNDFFDFVAHNPMVPAGREYVFARGLDAWVRGDMLVATHLLIPQLENSLRILVERAGGRTTTLNSEGLQQDRTLGSVLSAGELEDILGPNVMFDLRCLLIERFGANLRNLLSHGVASYADVYSPAASYLCWLVLHLCVVPVLRTSQDKETGGEP